jgi:coproporphyrinogen III oxidase
MILQVTEKKEIFVQHIQQLQDTICAALELEDGRAVFTEDKWLRPGGGGGRTRTFQKGGVFEKAGVNISEVYGEVTRNMRDYLQIKGDRFFATGISIVVHPDNPFVPAIHANFRYFELYDDQYTKIDSWYGGGMDITPNYLFEEDAIHFHRTLKKVCDRYDDQFYPVFKKNCDEYFSNRHRNNETRGIGGIFFDHLRQNEVISENDHFNFVIACSESFLSAYLPIVKNRKNLPYNEKHKYWQEIRRGRYVEFNLLHDKGTLFGLKTNGRTESILISLPPTVRFDYDHQPGPGTEEDKLLQVCRQPRAWV